MRSLKIEYSHEFISNKIKDELILNDIWNFNKIEKEIIIDIKNIFNFDIGSNRNINSLSGGQRSVTYLITLAYILKEKHINIIDLELYNILESLSGESIKKILEYLNERGINVTKE